MCVLPDRASLNVTIEWFLVYSYSSSGIDYSLDHLLLCLWLTLVVNPRLHAIAGWKVQGVQIGLPYRACYLSTSSSPSLLISFLSVFRNYCATMSWPSSTFSISVLLFQKAHTLKKGAVFFFRKCLGILNHIYATRAVKTQLSLLLANGGILSC